MDALATSWYWLALIGLTAGTLSGALGVGAGIILVPALVLGLGGDQKVAQGTSLAVMVPMAAMGWLRYHLNPDVQLGLGVIVILSLSALVGANLGASIAAWLSGVTLRRIFGAFAVGVGLFLMLR